MDVDEQTRRIVNEEIELEVQRDDWLDECRSVCMQHLRETRPSLVRDHGLQAIDIAACRRGMTYEDFIVSCW